MAKAPSPRLPGRFPGTRRAFIGTGLAAVGLAMSAAASLAPLPAQANAALDQADRADIARIEDYLSNIRSLRSEFTQSSSNGDRASGTLYVTRPGRLRFEYDPPTPVLVVADGSFLIYKDTQLGQTSHIPLSSSLAAFLLTDRVSFDKEVRVTGFRRAQGAMRLTVVKTDEPGAGQVTLDFLDNPLRLTQWVVRDAQGIVTRVALVRPQFGVNNPSDLYQVDAGSTQAPDR